VIIPDRINQGSTLAMVFKLCRQAEKTWRKLDGFQFLPHVVAGIKFLDGVMACLTGPTFQFPVHNN
jgi:hypothetical protein